MTTTATRVICPCCEEEVDHLENHHWYEADGSYHTEDICGYCNRILRSSRFGLGDHVLPDWMVQKVFVAYWRRGDCGGRILSPPLQLPLIEVSGRKPMMEFRLL